MKNIYGVVGIAMLVLIPVIVTPSLAIEEEEYINEELGIQWKILMVIGRINVRVLENKITGFAFVGYTNGELLIFERINIQFEGIPLFINNGLLFSFCFYKAV